MNAERQMLTNAALVLTASLALDEPVEALRADLGDERAAEALGRWLDEVSCRPRSRWSTAGRAC